ncbi:MAG: hypothetical protein GY943_11390, partial [Chloroflexi bacterium]|nr:hypothetical protein [Chloroflexota bacterium]
MKDRFLGCLSGEAYGDAVGTTAEFRPCGTFDPVADMMERPFVDKLRGFFTAVPASP